MPRLWPAHTGTATIALYLVMTLIMLCCWRLARHKQALNDRLIIGLGAFAVLVLAGADPYTTHDPERYLWDGAVLAHGYDPYRMSPDNEQVAELRQRWPTPAEHSAYPTLYPPLALTLFGIASLAGPTAGLATWKLMAAAAAVVLLLLMRRVLAFENRQDALPLVALSPLILLEAGVGAHIDIFAAVALVGAMAAYQRQQIVLTGLAIGVGVGIKLLPLLALPAFFWHATHKQRWGLLVGAVAATGSIYTLAILAGLQPVGSLGVFFEKWRFGSPIYTGLAQVVENPLPIAAVGAGVMVLLGCWRARDDWVDGLTLTLSAPLVFSPVVFPWYLLVLVPLVALRPRRVVLAWLAAAPLSYEVLNRFNTDGVWQPAVWPLVTIAVLCLAMGIWSVVAKRVNNNSITTARPVKFGL
ncbi:MAG: glycosyltransferase 87 family protein [Pseudomonadota bacterium]